MLALSKSLFSLLFLSAVCSSDQTCIVGEDNIATITCQFEDRNNCFHEDWPYYSWEVTNGTNDTHFLTTCTSTGCVRQDSEMNITIVDVSIYLKYDKPGSRLVSSTLTLKFGRSADIESYKWQCRTTDRCGGLVSTACYKLERQDVTTNPKEPESVKERENKYMYALFVLIGVLGVSIAVVAVYISWRKHKAGSVTASLPSPERSSSVYISVIQSESVSTNNPGSPGVQRNGTYVLAQPVPTGPLGDSHTEDLTSGRSVQHLAAGYELLEPGYGAGYESLENGYASVGHGYATVGY